MSVIVVDGHAEWWYVMPLIALIDGVRSRATLGARGICPHCEDCMVAKCGTLITWHWAHGTAACDPWAEAESAWHLSTKDYFAALGCAVEQRITDDAGRWHVADVVTPRGCVVELQHSPLDARKIADREAFYGDMAWIWHAERWAPRVHFGARGFWWKHGAKSQATCAKPILWDVGEWPRIIRVSLSVVGGQGTYELSGGLQGYYDEPKRVVGKVIGRYSDPVAALRKCA